MPARPLAFRYLYKSGVIKENTVTVFGEMGAVFQKGTDYDEEVDLTVPYMDLSNLIMYYTGTVADGTVGSSVEGSLRNLNAPVSNVRKFLKFTNADNASGANHYYVGDIVMFDPITGEGTSPNASCWTCVKTTTDLTSPIPELANEIAAASAADASYNTNFNGTGKSGPGMTGIDNRGQRFIVGVMPAIYDATTGDITINPYWRESALAKSYLSAGNYYQGELVVYNGGVYQCRSTNGAIADPPLYQRTRYTVQQENDDAIGIAGAIPGLDLALAPQGAFGFDSSGTRYLMGVPPTGGLFSGLFWEPATLPKTPSGAYLNINWDNTSVTSKLQFYDANVVGGGGAQSIPTFNDDMNNTITTLRKIYDDNEKSFVLTLANQILSSIPAAAIKSQAVNSKVEPDKTLLELVHLGPTNSKPSQYTPAVQGLFEESIFRDMLRISGYANTITELVVTDGSSGYTGVPSVQIVGGLATNPKLVPYYASAVARLGIGSVKIDKTHATWSSTTTGKRYAVGDVLTFVPVSTPTVACVAKVYRVDSAGNILSILVTNKGSGYQDLPTVRIGGTVRAFLEPVLEVVSVDLQYRDMGFYDGMKVVVQYGSGVGAVGYAVTEQINGQTRLVEVKFDATTGTTRTDPNTSEDFNVSRGTNYVSGNFKKDIVALQGYVSGNAVGTARSVGVVTGVQGGAISSLVVIKNGSGYTSNPSVVIASPDADARENGKLVGAPNVTLTGFLPPIQNRGVYTEAPPVSFKILDPPTDATALNVQGRSYLGLNTADVRFGGTGFSQGEYLNVSGGGITTAKFNVSHVTGAYSALVMDGGDGYSFDSTNTHLNQIVLQDDAAQGDELLAQITSVGGGIVDLTFNNGRPTGEGFNVDDIIEATPLAAAVSGGVVPGPFRFKVTSVGDKGTIPSDGYTVVTETSVTGYNAGQTVLARSKFLSIDTLTLDTPQVFSAPDQPTVSVDQPTGTITLDATTWAAVPATATASLKVNAISILNAGTGYQVGDVITISQSGASTCEAFVLALGDTTTGSVGVISVRNAGSGFDISQTITVTLPTTTGTPLQVSVSYRVDKIVVTNPGAGYEASATPAANLVLASGTNVPLLVTTKNAGGSSATFQVSSVNAGVPTLVQLSPGSNYIVGDLLQLIHDGASGAYITIQSTQSYGVRSGTVLNGYRSTSNVVSSTLINASVTKIGSTATYPNIRYAVSKVTSPHSISAITIVDTKPAANRYTSPTLLTHKPQARVKVNAVDSTGSILSLSVENPGYGYTSLPTIKPMAGTRGSGAALFAVSLGVSRVEFTGALLSVITSSDILVSNDGVIAAPRKRPARAIAQLAGDLNTISTDPLKNPNILESLESIKPGSTSGYAQAKPNMGVSSVEVISAGRGYQTGLSGQNQPITTVEVTEPDLPDGVKPTFQIVFDSLGGITNIVVLTSGSGYSKFPKALIVMSTSDVPSLPAAVSLKMKLLSGYVTSGGEGYTTPPSITVAVPDENIGASTSTLLPTMKTSINGFNIDSPGSQYLSTPEALVVGPGNGAEATASMGVSDIYVVDGGSGYTVGDILQIPAPTGANGVNANATVLAVNTLGSITRVGLTRSIFPVVAAELAGRKNDFITNGGSGYETPPVIPAGLLAPSISTADLYDAAGVPNSALTASTGSGAKFSTRLGVTRIDFTASGNEYESDATILIQSPPSSQVANVSAIINSVGQLSDYRLNSGGSGYTQPPGVTVDGNGAGATVTPLMGVSEVVILDPGRGYRVGDVVNITGGNPTEPANAVVTVIDRGSGGLGFDLVVTPSNVQNDALSSLSVEDGTGKLVGTVGAISQTLIVERGYGFEVGDIIAIKPETALPPQASLDRVRSLRGSTTILAGKLTTVALIDDDWFANNDFKAGMILKVTPGPQSTVDPLAVAYVRVNVVFDRLNGREFASVNDQYVNGVFVSHGSFIEGPGIKYGGLIPGVTWGYDELYAGIAVYGISGEAHTVLASNDKWGSDIGQVANSLTNTADKLLSFEVVTQDETKYPGSTAYFKVNRILSSVGAILELNPCNSAGVVGSSTGLFYSVYDLCPYTGVPRGRISFVQLLNKGSGYQTAPLASITTSSGPATTTAVLKTTLGVASIRIDQRGAGYTANPTITIEAPHHRSLTAKGYARSGVFDIDGSNTFEILDQGSGYTGQFLDGSNVLQDGGTYRLVGGALHQTGGSAESIDTLVTIGPGGFVAGLLTTDIAALQTAATTLVRGSNYRVGDVVQLMAVGSTTSDNLAIPAKLRIKAISKILDTNNGLTNNTTYNTGAGILDYAKQENGEDVGGYGTGYVNVPKILILGGNQGVTLATSLGLVGVDYEDVDYSGGTDYEIGDMLEMITPGFTTPVSVGKVTMVSSNSGSIYAVSLFEPFSKGLTDLPTLTVKRQNPSHRSTDSQTAGASWVRRDAPLVPVLGVTLATTTTSADGFIGRPYVFVDPPNGSGYIQQPTSARITPNIVNEVSAVNVFYDNLTPQYTTTLPTISIAPPPSIDKYSGWRSVRFNKDDSFEVIVQYTIAKAVSFQVDPDATLPGYYFTATAITIGGVVIPLRQSGGKGMQGRELSANRIIRRYKIKLIAV